MEIVRILSADAVFSAALYTAFSQNKRYEPKPVVQTGPELIERMLRERTDIVVIDLALPGFDGLDVLDVLESLPLAERPLIFAVADLCTPRLTEMMRDKLTYCFVKPADAVRTVGQIAMLTGMHRLPSHAVGGYAVLHRLVTEYLFYLGVSPHLNGYHLLREAVKLIACVRLPSRLSVMQNIYPAVASLCHTSVSMAEHAMRHAIESAWMRADIDTIERCFGYTVHEMRDTPSNSAFIFMLADRVRMTMADTERRNALLHDAEEEQEMQYA